MLDDSVMFARRLRAIGQPVTLRVVQDLPHGFLSLSQLCRETRQATSICTELIREILAPPDQDSPPPAAPTTSSSHRKHRKLERTLHTGPSTSQSTHHHSVPEDTTGTGQERSVGAASTESGIPSGPGVKMSTSSQHLRRGSGSSGGPPGKSKEMPTPPPGPALAVTPGQDSSPTSGTVGRGVGA